LSASISTTLTYDYLYLVIAVFGTTISPYLFFWQAAQEVEEMRRRDRPRQPLKALSRGGSPELSRIALDTTGGGGSPVRAGPRPR
jgi:Mn2+/Fe2+ NRAMP family transporter